MLLGSDSGGPPRLFHRAVADPSRRGSERLSGAAGRCGFLGLLHMDVFRQRLEQEYQVTLPPPRYPRGRSAGRDPFHPPGYQLRLPAVAAVTRTRPLMERMGQADIIITNPTVPFKARLKARPDEEITCSNPSLFPDQALAPDPSHTRRKHTGPRPSPS